MNISIYDYENYRAYLKDWFAGPGSPSQREFADRVGRSPALISSILAGNRDLDTTAMSNWSRHLGHGEDEARYFAALVELESPSRIRREAAAAHIRIVRRIRSAEQVTDDRLAVYINWFYVAILELAHCRDFRPDPVWLGRRVIPPVRPEQAQKALEVLEATKLLVRDEVGKLVPVDVLATSTEIPLGMMTAAMREWYLGTLDRAAEAFLSTPAVERHFATITVALSPSALPYLRKRMGELEQELVAHCAELEDRDRVYQLAFVLFPITHGPHSADGD